MVHDHWRAGFCFSSILSSRWTTPITVEGLFMSLITTQHWKFLPGFKFQIFSSSWQIKVAKLIRAIGWVRPCNNSLTCLHLAHSAPDLFWWLQTRLIKRSSSGWLHSLFIFYCDDSGNKYQLLKFYSPSMLCVFRF